jgi:hypothetical protein
MHLFKIVFAFLAIGGTGYALFRLSQDVPGWVKVLSFVMGIATLIGAVIVLPQALDALEQSAERVAKWFAPSPEELQRRTQEEARRRAEAETRQREAEEAARREKDEQDRRAAAEYSARMREYEARAKAEETARKRAEEEATRSREAEARRRADEEAERERRQREAARREDERRERDRAAAEEKRRLMAIVRADRCKAVSVCPPGKIFSLSHGECIHLQYYGGIIPGSQDDASFDSRTGRWVPNCR